MPDVRFGSKAAATADGDRVCFTPDTVAKVGKRWAMIFSAKT
jgi:hypothetical protein